MHSSSVAVWKKAALVVVALASLLYARASWQHYSAYRYASEKTVEGLRTATRIEPGNAEYFQTLGAYELAAFEPDRARQALVRSTRLNAWDSRTWLLLANAYNILGDLPNQQAALDAAYAADPKTPDVAWEVANFYLVLGQDRKALELFRTVITSGSEKSADAFRIAWQATRSVDTILSVMMPPSVDAHLQLLSFLTEKNEADAAGKVWDKLVASKQPIPISDSNAYVDFLISDRRVDDAVRAWDDGLKLNGNTTLQRGGSLIVNGDFEEPFSGGGFDWHYTRNSACPASIDSTEGQTGTHSLFVNAMGRFDQVGLFQFVPVAPGEKYELAAYMKSEDIQSNSGPRLAVSDAYTGRLYGTSDDLLETNVWREQSIQFTAGTDTRLVVIKVVRVPGDSMIKGKFWVDNIRLFKR